MVGPSSRITPNSLRSSTGSSHRGLSRRTRMNLSASLTGTPLSIPAPAALTTTTAGGIPPPSSSTTTPLLTSQSEHLLSNSMSAASAAALERVALHRSNTARTRSRGLAQKKPSTTRITEPEIVEGGGLPVPTSTTPTTPNRRAMNVHMDSVPNIPNLNYNNNNNNSNHHQRNSVPVMTTLDPRAQRMWQDAAAGLGDTTAAGNDSQRFQRSATADSIPSTGTSGEPTLRRYLSNQSNASTISSSLGGSSHHSTTGNNNNMNNSGGGGGTVRPGLRNRRDSFNRVGGPGLSNRQLSSSQHNQPLGGGGPGLSNRQLSGGGPGLSNRQLSSSQHNQPLGAGGPGLSNRQLSSQHQPLPAQIPEHVQQQEFHHQQQAQRLQQQFVHPQQNQQPQLYQQQQPMHPQQQQNQQPQQLYQPTMNDLAVLYNRHVEILESKDLEIAKKLSTLSPTIGAEEEFDQRLNDDDHNQEDDADGLDLALDISRQQTQYVDPEEEETLRMVLEMSRHEVAAAGMRSNNVGPDDRPDYGDMESSFAESSFRFPASRQQQPINLLAPGDEYYPSRDEKDILPIEEEEEIDEELRRVLELSEQEAKQQPPLPELSEDEELERVLMLSQQEAAPPAAAAAASEEDEEEIMRRILLLSQQEVSERDKERETIELVLELSRQQTDDVGS